MRVACICLLLTLGWTLAAGDECHHPKLSNVGTHPGLAADICAIGAALDSTPPDYSTAEAIYEKGRNTKSPTLMFVATGEFSTRLWQQYAEYFGDQSWLDVVLLRAFKGRKPFVNHTMRTQVIKKVLQSAVLQQGLSHHMEDTLALTRRRQFAEALGSWERAMAVYYGADADCALFGNGQSRGIEFGTLKEDMAETNYEVGEKFGEGAEILKGDKPSFKKLKTVIQDIEKYVLIIYIQSTLKYASIIDEAIETDEDFEKAQAEGFGYMHAILPVVAQVNPEAADRIFSTFDLRRIPTEEEAERVKEDLESVYEDLGIDKSQVNFFDDTRKDEYEAPDELPCEAVNPFAGDVAIGDTDADR